MSIRRLSAGWLSVVLLGGVGLVQADTTKIDGRVVDAAGKPVAGAEVGSIWNFEDGAGKTWSGAKTDADGRFHFENEFYKQPGALLTLDAERHSGGMVLVDPTKPIEPVVITMGPVARVHGDFSSRELNKPPGWTNVYMLTGPTDIRIASCSSLAGKFNLILPVGKYVLNGYGSEEVVGMARRVELKADKPDLDLGTIDLKASALGKMYGKEAPPLHITDARGISREMKLSDLRGKWVALDFWGHWCGPCVGRSLPDLMEIYDAHPDDRDKFVVLAFHSKDIDNFRDLDEKLVPIVRDTWRGRELPFPILLDSTGKTVEEYGIQAWPTTVLINPEGIVVRGGEYALRKALPEVPLARRISRALDKSITFGLSDGIKLAAFAKLIGQFADIPVQLDEAALKAAGIAPDAKIPLVLSGRLTTRAWLALGLRPLGLVAVPGAEGINITAASPGSPAVAEPTPLQGEINAKIRQKLATGKVSFDFTNQSLAEVAQFFENQTGENFVLDPGDRLAGRLDPKLTIRGRATDAPLDAALRNLFSPLGIEAVVRDEVVVLTRPAHP